MKSRKKLIIVLAIIILIIIVCIILLTKKDKNSTQIGETTSNATQKVKAPEKELPDETTDIILYIGEGKNYTQVPAKYNKDANKEEQVKRILEKIGITVGYKIEINKVEVTEEKILIDFKSTSAPFNDSAYFGGEEEGLFVADYKTLVYKIFDSIKKTLQEIYGNNISIYYTLEERGMRFNNIVPQLVIGENIPYNI